MCRGRSGEVEGGRPENQCLPAGMALKRFIVTRGNIRTIWSDDGSSFTETKNQLKKPLKKWITPKSSIFCQTMEQIGWYRLKIHQQLAMWVEHENKKWSARNILSSLLKTHEPSLNEWSSFNFDGRVGSYNELTITYRGAAKWWKQSQPSQVSWQWSKLKVISLLEKFEKHIFTALTRNATSSEEFWSSWRKEFLVTLQLLRRMNCSKQASCKWKLLKTQWSNKHTMSNQRRLDVDIIRIHWKQNINKYQRYFHLNFQCSFDGRKIDVVLTYFLQHNFDGQKINVVSAYFLPCNSNEQKIDVVLRYFAQYSFDERKIKIVSEQWDDGITL